MFSYRFATAVVTARRTMATLNLATALALSTLGLPAPAVTAAQPAEPAARLQVVVKGVKIHDDREGLLSGDGEMSLTVQIRGCDQGVPLPCLAPGSAPIVRAGSLFNASTGQTVTLDREVPQVGDQMWGRDTSPELGFAVSAGRRYVVYFHMEEWDSGGSSIGGSNEHEDMGDVEHVIDTGEHGLGVGTHTARSVRDNGVTPGDYTVTYEIRRAALPDLRPVNIQVQELPGTIEKRICMAVQNVEVGHAGPFEVALKVDGVVPRDGRYTVGLLASGTHFWACVETALPTSGRHTLAAVVDEPRKVAEYNETNNVYEQPYQGAGPSVAPTPSAPLPDLTVGAIKVNGRVPDGEEDCKEGKNTVIVVVKNVGVAKAGTFAVRLAIDGDDRDAREKSVEGIEAGKEWDVRFDDVRLKKGDRTLTVTLDSQNAITESEEGKSQRTLTAWCTDD